MYYLLPKAAVLNNVADNNTEGSLMKKIYVILAVMLVVVISGCTGGNTPPAPDRGITINSFETSQGVVEAMAGEPVIFDMEIENVGGTTANNVVIELHDIDG